MSGTETLWLSFEHSDKSKSDSHTPTLRCSIKSASYCRNTRNDLRIYENTHEWNQLDCNEWNHMRNPFLRNRVIHLQENHNTLFFHHLVIAPCQIGKTSKQYIKLDQSILWSHVANCLCRIIAQLRHVVTLMTLYHCRPIRWWNTCTDGWWIVIITVFPLSTTYFFRERVRAYAVLLSSPEVGSCKTSNISNN